MSREKHQLKVENIKKEYEGKLLLKGISLEVNTGEVLCLLGQSGSGKSTLLRIITGIETADSGKVLWDDQEISLVPTHLRHFGLMFQDYALFPHLNVAENIAFGVRMQNTSKTEITRIVKESLEQVNLSGFENRSVSDLSGGEQQRVALARALAPSPRLLMLDEPLAALDKSLREQLQNELREVLHQTNIPAIYVTHDQQEAFALGDRLALLNDGSIVQNDLPEEVYKKPANAWVARFLGFENIFSGKVKSIHPLTIVFANRIFTAVAPELKLTPGQTVNFVLLPGNITQGETRGQENSLRVVVESCIFRGDQYRITSHLSDGTLFVFYSPEPLQEKKEVTLSFGSQNVVCIPN